MSLEDFSRAALDDRAPISGDSFRHWTIADYTSRYADGVVTPTQVVRAVLAAIAESERGPTPLKLFIEIDMDQLLAEAMESTARYAAGEPLGVLDGVPVAVKDTMAVRGLRTWAGTSFLGDTHGPAETDDPAIARLRAAGAIIIGKTNMHELGAGLTGFNAHHGTVRNPHNANCYTGGSSSGSAAAVACGIVPLAVGQDGGGSTRVPAALCGVVGLKPTFQRVPPLSTGSPSLSHIGPIAGCVRDAAIGLAIMSGGHESFPRGLHQPALSLQAFDEIQSLKGVRVAFFQRYNDHSSPEIAAAITDALHQLQVRGAELVPVSLPTLSPIHMAHSVTIAAEFALLLDNEAAGVDLDALSPEAQMVLTFAAQCSATDFVAAQRVRAFALRQFQEQVLSKADAFVTPMTALTAPEIPLAAFDAGEVNARQQAAFVRYSWYSNMVGTPAVTVPIGYDARWMPIGLQLQSAHWDEDLMLRLAHAAEDIYAQRQRRPAVYFSILDRAASEVSEECP